MAIIRRLPEEDLSSFFGLPPNIDSTIQFSQYLHFQSRIKCKFINVVIVWSFLMIDKYFPMPALYQTTVKSIATNPKILLAKLTSIFTLWKSLIQVS